MRFEPYRHWDSGRALRAARASVLEIARRLLRQRRAASLANEHAHTGFHHLELFREEFPQIVAMLPEGFRAVEVGAGLGWMALLLAAHAPKVSVLATELEFGGEGPHGLPNAFTLYRMAEREKLLGSVVKFRFDATRELVGMELTDRVDFARAGAEALPLPDGSCEFVYSINCLEHVADLPGAFREAERVLAPGGICLHTTEPLYFSPYGHHLGDFFPVPWGHLLWQPEDLAEVAMKEIAPGTEWLPGVPLTARHLTDEVFPSLNQGAPGDLRRAMKPGAWEILGWRDIEEPDVEDLIRETGIREAVRRIPVEALMLRGLRVRLVRRESTTGMRLAMRLPYTLRARLRRLRELLIRGRRQEE